MKKLLTLLTLVLLSLTSFSQVETIKVSTDPINSYLTINSGNVSITSGYQLRIINLLSQVIFEAPFDQAQFDINLTSLSGNYVYSNIIDQNGKTINSKRIKINSNISSN